MNTKDLDQQIRLRKEKLKSLEKKLKQLKKSKPDVIDLVSDDSSISSKQKEKNTQDKQKNKKQKGNSDQRQYIDVTYQGIKAAKKLKARWDGIAWYIPKYISNEEKQKLRKKYNPKQVKTSSKQVKSSSKQVKTSTSEKQDKIIKNMREHRRFTNMLMLEKRNPQRIYIDVPFEKRKIAKEKGNARYDRSVKSWYVTKSNFNKLGFKRKTSAEENDRIWRQTPKNVNFKDYQKYLSDQLYFSDGSFDDTYKDYYAYVGRNDLR